MERDEELKQYRQTLAKQLESQQRLRAEADLETLRIFVNHRCVGRMDCEDGRATFISSFEKEEVALLEVRTDSGILVGSAAGTGAHERTCRVLAGNQGHTLTLHLENHGDRGAVTVSYRPPEASGLRWTRLVDAPLMWIKQSGRAVSELSWAMQTSLALQLVLAVGFAYLLLHPVEGDRQVVTPADLQALHTRQTESGVQQITRMRQDIEALAKDQQVLREQLVSYEKAAARSAIEIEHRVERRLQPELQKTTLEMVSIRQQVQELATAKDAMKQDLAAALQQQAETRARMKVPSSSEGPQSFRATTSPPLAQADEPPKVAGGSRAEELKPLIFWVSFHEGTTEKSVEDLLHQIRGRKIKGPTPTGWINVEAQLKQSESIEGFFETVKKVKIVSAITTSLSGQ